jgi:hypothetical protein
MMMEKRGVVEPGRTPSETDEKRASADSLTDHVTKRAEDTVVGTKEAFEQVPPPRRTDESPYENQ